MGKGGEVLREELKQVISLEISKKGKMSKKRWFFQVGERGKGQMEQSCTENEQWKEVSLTNIMLQRTHNFRWGREWTVFGPLTRSTFENCSPTTRIYFWQGWNQHNSQMDYIFLSFGAWLIVDVIFTLCNLLIQGQIWWGGTMHSGFFSFLNNCTDKKCLKTRKNPQHIHDS